MIKITHSDASYIYGALTSKDLDIKNAKFNYFVAKNIAILKPEIEALRAASKQSDEMIKFEKEKFEAGKKYAETNDKNKPKITIIDGVARYKIVDEEGFETEIKELEAKYADVIEEDKKRQAEFEQFLQKEVEIDFFKIKANDLPEGLTTKQVIALYPLIEE